MDIGVDSSIAKSTRTGWIDAVLSVVERIEALQSQLQIDPLKE